MSAAEMTPEEIAVAKSIVQHAAVNSLETDEVMLLGHAIQEVERLRAELARLRSAPVAVEVPTWSTDAFCTHVGLEGAFSAGDIRVFFAGAKACHGWISNEVHPIPSDRVLKEGEVAVPETQWTVAQMLANAWERFPLKCGERDALVAEWNALRSSKEGA